MTEMFTVVAEGHYDEATDTLTVRPTPNAAITGETFDHIARAIRPHDSYKRREMYRTGQFPRADVVKDLDKRYRWDLFWTVFSDLQVDFSTYNDNHIDTALRSIVAPLEGGES